MLPSLMALNVAGGPAPLPPVIPTNELKPPSSPPNDSMGVGKGGDSGVTGDRPYLLRMGVVGMELMTDVCEEERDGVSLSL